MENEYCPTCSMLSINRGICGQCGRDFNSNLFRRRPSTFKRFNDLPAVRDGMPYRIAHKFRDSGWKKQCGVTSTKSTWRTFRAWKKDE